MLRIGIDLGGTKIEGIALQENGYELLRKRIETEQSEGYSHILKRIEALYGELVDHTHGEPHTFGIATPGTISLRTGLSRNSNTLCLNGRPLRNDLEQVLGRKIAIQNDANCFALAEGLLGAGKGKKLAFGVNSGHGLRRWHRLQRRAGHRPARHCRRMGTHEHQSRGSTLLL